MSSPKRIPPTPWGMLPPELKVLAISDPHNEEWLGEAFRGDRICSVQITMTPSTDAAFEALHEADFDCLLILHEGNKTIEMLAQMKSATQSRLPILVLGNLADREFSALCFEAGADGFLTIDTITIRELLWHIARAAERATILAENERLRAKERQHAEIAHEQLLNLIGQQRAAIGSREAALPLGDDWLRKQLEQLLTSFASQSNEQFDEDLRQFCSAIAKTDFADLTVVDTLLQIMASSAKQLGPKHSESVYQLGSVLIFELLKRTSVLAPKIHVA